MKRPENWPMLLEAHLKFWAQQKFEWGRSDCVHFAASWLTQLRYPAPLAGLPSWDSALSASRIFTQLGGFEKAIDAQLYALRCPRIPVTFAMRGDLCLCDSENGPALGVCKGRDVALLSEQGLTELPTIKRALVAWKV